MKRDDVIRMAREAGFETAEEWDKFSNGFVHVVARFAALVAAAERAACSDICDQHASIEGIAQRCADAIRARGQA
jgi:hypothetical protein